MPQTALPTARDWMSTNILSFTPDQPIFEAIETLLSHSYAAAPVLDEKRRVLGILTEKDCLRILTSRTYEGMLDTGHVADYQSALRGLCEPDNDLFRVIDLFLSNNFPLLPVVDTDGKLCGVISRRDALRGLRSLRHELARRQGVQESNAGHQTDRPRSIEGLQKAAASQSPRQLAQLMRRDA